MRQVQAIPCEFCYRLLAQYRFKTNDTFFSCAGWKCFMKAHSTAGRFRYAITYNQAGFSNHSYRVLLAERSLGHIPRHMLKTGKK